MEGILARTVDGDSLYLSMMERTQLKLQKFKRRTKQKGETEQEEMKKMAECYWRQRKKFFKAFLSCSNHHKEFKKFQREVYQRDDEQNALKKYIFTTRPRIFCFTPAFIK